MFQPRTKMWNFLPGYERKTNNKFSEDSLKKKKKGKEGEKKKLKSFGFLKKCASFNFYYLHISVTQQHHTDKAQRKCSS